MLLEFLIVKVVIIMFNHRTYYPNYPHSMYGYGNQNYRPYTTFTNGTEPSHKKQADQEPTEKNTSNTTSKEDTSSRNETENKFRLGPLTVSNDQIEIFGFSFAMDDLIIIGLMLILFLDSDSDFVLLIILGLMLFNVSFSSLNLF